MQSVAQKISLLKQAVTGEIETSIDNALKRIYPDESLKLADLKRRDLRGGVTSYSHPETGALVAEVSVRHAHEKSVLTRSKWNRSFKVRETHKIPYKETIVVFGPRGNPDTRIAVEQVVPNEITKEPVRMITSIKEYYPPKKEKHRHIRNKTSDGDMRRMAMERHEASLFKMINASASADNAGNMASLNPSAETGTGIQTELMETHTNGTMNAALDLAAKFKRETRLSSGPLRRERTYAAVKINGSDKKEVQKDAYTLAGRIKGDRINNPEGDYTIIRYTGSKYTTIHYNEQGRRLSQHSYNSEGELTKALGEAAVGGAPKKEKYIPSDKVSLMMAKRRDAVREAYELRREWKLVTVSSAAFDGEVEQEADPYAAYRLRDYDPSTVPEEVKEYFLRLKINDPVPKAEIKDFVSQYERSQASWECTEKPALPQSVIDFLDREFLNEQLPKDIRNEYVEYRIGDSKEKKDVSWSFKNYLSRQSREDFYEMPGQVKLFFYGLVPGYNVPEHVQLFVKRLQRNDRRESHNQRTLLPPEDFIHFILNGWDEHTTLEQDIEWHFAEQKTQQPDYSMAAVARLSL